MASEATISLSVVVPVYSGAHYLPALVEELDALRQRWIEDGAPLRLTEVVMVDDAAIDDSPEIIDRLAGEQPWITVLHLMRNFGQHAATIAGILHTSGDWVVTMDEDLQHPPKAIEQLVWHAVKTASDIVYARPNSAVHEVVARDMSSRLFKRLLVLLSGNQNVQNFNSFRLIRGPLARAASSVCGHETYFDVALSWFTQRVGALSIELKDQRIIKGEKSGYKFSKLLSHARRMVISSQIKVLRLGALLGLISIGVSFFLGLYIVLEKLFFPAQVAGAGWASLALISTFFGGVITLLLGIVIEYISTLILVANGKPLFFVADRRRDLMLREYYDARRL